MHLFHRSPKQTSSCKSIQPSFSFFFYISSFIWPPKSFMLMSALVQDLPKTSSKIFMAIRDTLLLSTILERHLKEQGHPLLMQI